ncbi:hypothetical protein BHE74_00015422 [Ensete ventricosum]|nr:hypothetical protein BHE74_00015422 [Ensete ventricosum]
MEGGTRENGAEAAAGRLAAVAEEGVEEAEAVGSSSTMERVAAAKKFIENHYRNQKKNIQERKERLVGSGSLSLVLASDQKIHGLGLSTNPSGLVRDIQLQINMLKDLERKETEYMRLKRHKICVDDFELLTIIGRGAFGEV